MVYEWDEHQQTCYRLYIEEGMSLEDIRLHMKTVYNFTPSERAFRNQFRRWNFPSKQRTVAENNRMEGRVKELWETNLSQREMLRVLKEEGFDIKLRELVRMRFRNRWLLRMSRKQPLKAAAGDEGLLAEEMHHARAQPTQPTQQDFTFLNAHKGLPGEEAPLKKMSKRQEKRKAGRAAGQEGTILRFPSETTLDDARQMLGLTVSMYRDMRTRFQKVCEEEGIIKKTDAGVVRWDFAKEKLIQQMPQLQLAVWSVQGKIESRQIALDVICTDVTKRMRILEARMTLAEAKNILGINPQQFREMRFAFYEAISEAGIARKSNATPEEWEGLKRAWGSKSALLAQILANLKPEQNRAFDVLTRDILKRRWDGRRRDEKLSCQQARPAHPCPSRALDSSTLLIPGGRTSSMSQPFVQSQFSPAEEATPTPVYQQVQSVPTVCAMYMRLHPSSSFVPGSNLWISTLASHSVEEIRQVAAEKYPGTTCVRVEAVIKDGKGGELPLPIEHDEELGAYIAHLQGAAPTFNVQMVWETL
ncbi:hypothetical protein E4U41_003167 [Claviceps citrina]|nr:hypothetical protein E4U41_003167 [Claviceps citrina]